MNRTELSKLTELKLQHEAVEQGIELIGPGRDANFRTYRLACGHEREIQTSKVRHGKFKCQTCGDSKAERKLHTEAAEQGIQLVRPGRDAHHRAYRLECGHEQQITTSAVRRGEFKCRTCLDEKLHAEAREQGIQLIGPGRDANFRTYRLVCGHEQEIMTGSVRIGSFDCRTCGNHSWTKPSHLYVIRVELDDGQSYIKLGYAENTERRVKGYGLPHYATATVLATALFTTRIEAKLAESMLFERYLEWKTPLARVEDIFTESGSTEVYDRSIEDDVVRLVLAIGERMINTKELTCGS